MSIKNTNRFSNESISYSSEKKLVVEAKKILKTIFHLKNFLKIQKSQYIKRSNKKSEYFDHYDKKNNVHISNFIIK
jgi:predicted nucleic-acid-binding Zn-ribbon protein